MLLLLDNYDSFTYNLYDYFLQCGAECEVIRNDELDVSTVLSKYKGIIISPGPGTPENAGCTMEILEKFSDKLPIFGVCLGLQAIGQFYGATLKKANYPMHGKVSEVNCTVNHPLFKSITPPLEVCRYHSLIVEDFEELPINVIAETENGEVMAIEHQTLPIWAVQFHPESILTPQGLKLIRNWLSCFSLHYTTKL
ncbi:MAG: aminodeoxychorismate/anthranilate synthase component II [Bacteroidia bacterium]|nr:aminodeoxychorismate/anthranilate synthase component II [Bacteroidia bacterium]NNJ55306.1 aminodeoxychorismate/anthranilate synthase component II [Bacteroidia bacterium]